MKRISVNILFFITLLFLPFMVRGQECNSNFTYCYSTSNSSTLDFSAVYDPEELWVLNWTIDGTSVASDYDFMHTFASTGTYEVCLKVDAIFPSEETCKTCVMICVNTPYTTSVESIEDLEGMINVYPIPSQNYLVIDFVKYNKPISEPVTVTIWDIKGREWHAETISTSQLSKFISVDISSFPVGTYELQLSINNNFYSTSFIKQ